jgi:hypothetical protein
VKHKKITKPLDVFESEVAQAQIIIDEQTQRNLTIINQDHKERDPNAPLVSVKPEVNRKKRKCTNLFRLYYGDSPSRYCGNLLQVVNMIHEATEAILRDKKARAERKAQEKAEAEKIPEVVPEVQEVGEVHAE